MNFLINENECYFRIKYYALDDIACDITIKLRIVTFDSCQGQRDAPRYFHSTNSTVKHPNTHDVQKTTHHTATTAAAKITARHHPVTTTPSHTTKVVQKKCLNKMKPQDLMSLLFGLIPRIKTIEFIENENLQKLTHLIQEIFKQ
ncbi:unnamed protein product [Schistosoma spindalis]|nr:unnamed protein product [Schistosoma spindale]